MKKFNTQLIVPFIITLLLTGCMPDSLTKFKKEEAKKAVVTKTTTSTGSNVVDDSGVLLPFTASTYFGFGSASNPVKIATVGTALSVDPIADGTLGDSTVVAKFFEKCEIISTGVDSQAQVLPNGVTLNSNCQFVGTPITPKSVVTAYCSDGVSATQAACEAAPLIWNSTTLTCSLPDLAYVEQTVCQASFHKWYEVGGAVPYRVKLTYHNNYGVQKFIYTNFNLAVYKTLTAMDYTQSDKMQLKVTGSTAAYNAIVPLQTSTATVGAYARANSIISNGNVLSVAKLVDSAATLIAVNKLIPIKLASTTPFVVNTFIGKSSDTDSVGKIYKVDSANRIIYVENLSPDNKSFVAGETICVYNTGTGLCSGADYTITDISESYIFKKTNLLDNDKQYFSQAFKVSEVPTNIFQVGADIKSLKPVATTEISSTNGITYTVTPALPCSETIPTDCLTLDSSTGVISGKFGAYLANTEFTITATNPLGSVSTVIGLGAIIAPGDLSLTNKQIITISSNAPFKEGETLIQPITPPLVDALSAKILKKIGNYQLAIETFNGAFVPGASLDNNNSAFQAEKAYIIPYSSCTDTNYTTETSCLLAGYVWAPSAAVHYNIALSISTTGSYAAGDYVTALSGSGAGAYGLVSFVQTGATDELFVQYLTQTATSTTAAPTFYEGDGLDVGGATVTQVQNGTMAVKLANSSAGDFLLFAKGSDVISSMGASAYTNAVDTTTKVLSLSEISKLSTGTGFKIGQRLENHETAMESTANAATNDITAVTHTNYYIFERGKTMYATGNISTGSGISYSISPALPSGLTLNTSTGTISGSATGLSIKKDYIMTATNFIGSSTFVVSIEVKDFFEVIEKTGASSAILHKVGDYEVNRKCRIDALDVLDSSPNSKALDIRCFLDMEEQDVFESNLKLNFFTGGGICQYIRYEPYYFNAWQPHQTTNVSTRYTAPAVVRTGCDALSSETPPTTDMCEGNYKWIDSDYPNCDEGKLMYYSEVYSQNATSKACSKVSTTVNYVSCGGKKTSCLSGPVTDLLTTASLDAGNRNKIISSASGINVTYTHASPSSKGDQAINIRTANGTINNQCYSTKADALTWKNTTAALNKLTTPMGSDSNPFYTVTCLNAAYDIKARIRIIARDWDRTFRIDNDIYNQEYTGGSPATYMNNNNADPVFGGTYNNFLDWDDSYQGAASTYTTNSCGVQAAGTCTNISGVFTTSSDCTAVGGTVITPPSCSDAGKTTYISCVSSGTCSDVTYTDAGSCGKNLETWTAATWTPSVCNFSNQNQCEYYGGTWGGGGSQQLKFPNDSSGNLLGL